MRARPSGPPFGRALLSMLVASSVATSTALRAAFRSRSAVDARSFLRRNEHGPPGRLSVAPFILKGTRTRQPASCVFGCWSPGGVELTRRTQAHTKTRTRERSGATRMDGDFAPSSPAGRIACSGHPGIRQGPRFAFVFSVCPSLPQGEQNSVFMMMPPSNAKTSSIEPANCIR